MLIHNNILRNMAIYKSRLTIKIDNDGIKCYPFDRRVMVVL
ncbi:MAG: hypothetical protein ABI430_03070 [Candidatus Taylorbacteria bacterium]